jgi:hypothetical protein
LLLVLLKGTASAVPHHAPERAGALAPEVRTMPKPKWIPKDMEWFLADIIQELKVADADDSTVWINTHLIKASSPEEAYEKALNHGKLYDNSWTNTDGELVVSRFRGLRDLLLIYEKLEDGAEIMWEEQEDVSEQDIQEMIKPRALLGAIEVHGTKRKKAPMGGNNHVN